MQWELEGRKRDALANARVKLIGAKMVDAASLDQMDDEVAREMNGAVEHAIAAAAPDQDSMFRDVFAEGETRPRPLREHLAAILREAR